MTNEIEADNAGNEYSIHDDAVSKAIHLMAQVCLAIMISAPIVFVCLEVSGVSL